LADNLELNITSNNLAYVIYTSGTTGKPKGVLQQHNNVHRLLSATQNWYNFNSQDVWTLFHSYVFDFSIWELYGALSFGGKLVIPSHEQTRDPALFHNLCQQHKVSVLNQTPTAFYQFMQHSLSLNKLSSLRYVIFGGEALNIEQLSPWFNRYGDEQPQLVNMYGITETTVHVTYKPLKLGDVGRNSYIGIPIPDQKIYVLDSQLQPLPIGAIGELYVGGAGLARGYLNLPELTAERFITNQFQTKGEQEQGINARLYKTGDLVRYLPDGNIEYIGRNDFQVKIRGFRIELGEIENQVAKLDNVKQAVVLALDQQGNSNNKYLVAYYVADSVLNHDEMLSQLAQVLPEYMVPSILVHLQQLPLTINGKLDRKALPEPQFTTNADNYLAPRTELEQQLCNIYAQVLTLNVEEIGINDDFFKLGGDSILAIRVVNKINSECQIKLSVRNIFNHKTILSLSELITNNVITDKTINPKPQYLPFSLVCGGNSHETLADKYPASYLQIGMLLESELGGNNGTYHDVFAYQVNAKLDQDKAIATINHLVISNELLRARFISGANGYIVEVAQTIYPEIIFAETNQHYLLADLIEQERKNNFAFDKFGLHRWILVNNSQGFYLIFSFHHALVDGWSVASLINSFAQLYQQPLIEQLSYKLPYYGEFIANEIEAINNQEQIKFWQNYLDEIDINLVKWNFTNSKSDNGLYVANYELSQEETYLIHSIVKEHGVSADSIFLNAYLNTLSQFLNSQDVTIGLVVNNRLEVEHGDSLIGLFLNTIPFRFKVTNSANSYKDIFAEKIKLYEYKHIPYAIIKNLCGKDLYQFAFNFVNFHVLRDNEQIVESVNGFEKTNIPFTLNIVQEQDTFILSAVGHDNIIDQEYLNYLLNYICHNLRLIILASDNNETSNKLINDDYQQIVYDWNNTAKDYPADKTIHQLFEEQVTKTPNNIAVVYEYTQLTYAQLNAKANQLSHYLRETYQIQGDDLIALCLERSELMLIAILGVLKAGGAYVPLDPSYPADRISYVLSDTKAKVLIANQINQDKLVEIINSLTIINDKDEQSLLLNQTISKQVALELIDSSELQYKLANYSADNPEINITSNNLAYVIYTSGTTGKPKGVMIEHKNVGNLIFNTIKNSRQIDLNSKVLAFAPYVFDSSVAEVFPTLIAGAQIFLLSENNRKDLNQIN
ncbi:MAG: hypothetical protein RLZZ293_815, partial [Pseudomonadota bacterium]